MRTHKRTTEEIGARNVKEKKDAVRQGLEIDTDMYGRFREWLRYVVYWDTDGGRRCSGAESLAKHKDSTY
jgi:hypothetical protein